MASSATACYAVPMKNIEQFNLYTAHIFSVLLEAFPMQKVMEAKEIAEAMKEVIPFSVWETSHAYSFVGYTVLWLADYDFIGRRGDVSPFRYVLTPKSLERLNAVPTALLAKEAETGDKNLGEVLKNTTDELAKEAGKEAKKQIVARVVGEILGHAGRAFMGS